jgi:peptidoglycan/xylan/chitin deacetylase (PgdA/CDA1 family)
MSSLYLLVEELDRWRGADRLAEFWWRDDDAISYTPALDKLLKAAANVPIAIAVVPSTADGSLATRFENEENIDVLQHGWAHENHANAPPSSEYPPGRPADEVRNEFRNGRARLLDLFGDRALPVFAPPWHGFDETYLDLLSSVHLTGFSTKDVRSSREIRGLRQANIHCALIAWTSPPSFGDDEPYVLQICAHLRGRRTGRFDPQEPTGILTHHLVQDDVSYIFLKSFCNIIAEHPAARWVSARELFRSA